MKCQVCGYEKVNGKCLCKPKLTKCKFCNNYGRQYYEDGLICWDCRGKVMRGHPNEDWRDKMLREYCRDKGIHKMTEDEMRQARGVKDEGK